MSYLVDRVFRKTDIEIEEEARDDFSWAEGFTFCHEETAELAVVQNGKLVVLHSGD